MLKRLLTKIFFKEKCDSDTYIQYLRSIGMKIGNGVTIFTPRHVLIDTQYPWMVSIGNNVKITQGVSIIDHDFSWSVLKNHRGQYGAGNILGASGKIVIGNNVFIGVGATILRNTEIGDNVIIGAGSVVSKDCKESGVYAGNPARYICSIESYYEKRHRAQFEEAKELASNYYARFGKMPTKEVFHEYFMLFEHSEADIPEVFRKQMQQCGNFEESKKYLVSHKPMFANFEAFIEACELEKKW